MANLTVKEQQIAAISANTARGNLADLKQSLNAGLDAGLTVNEIKEVLTQLYAYCGFPRSLNALGTFMTVVNERGNKDVQGNTPSPLPAGKSIDFGTENQIKLCGAPVAGALFEFAPAIDEYLKAHLFGDIFGRDNLDWRTREIATVAALAALDGVKPQLDAHIAIAKHNGVTEAQIAEILAIVTPDPRKVSAFPVGAENTGYAQYFSGKSYLAPLTKDKRLNTPMFNVTFEPGCRNNWHKHTGGQMLIAVGGVGFYQERGQAARKLLPGDVVEIAPDVEHWHGASPDSFFSHLAIECNPATNKNTWLEAVSDADYQRATSSQSKSLVRISKVIVEPAQLDEYMAFATECGTRSMAEEPGVLMMYSMADKTQPNLITILEIYTDQAAYEKHIASSHFQKYKQGTLKMVQKLELLDQTPLIPEMKMK